MGLTVQGLFFLEHSTVPFSQADPRLVLYHFPSLETLVKQSLLPVFPMCPFHFALFFFFLHLLFSLYIPFSPFAFTSLIFYSCISTLCFCFIEIIVYKVFFPSSEISGYNLHLVCGYIFLMGSGFKIFIYFASHYLGFAFFIFLLMKYHAGSILLLASGGDEFF